MDDDQLQSIALVIANSDRILHNITEMPAIFNEFRDSFKIRGGVLSVKNNVDVCTAAEVAKAEFSGTIEAGHPLWGTLESSVVVTEVDADVGGTHVSGASGSTTIADADMSPDLNDRSVQLLRQLGFSASGQGVRGTSASARSASAGSGDVNPTARPCAYSDFRLDDRAPVSHGEADAAAAGLSTRMGWKRADVPGGFVMQLPYGAAGPAPAPSEATPHDEPKAKMWTWLSNNMPAAPPQPVPGADKGKGKSKGRGSFLLDSGSPAMNTWVPSLPKPSTAANAWQSTPAAENSKGSAWDQTGEPWNADSNRGWQGQRWSGRHWQDDADRPPAAKRGSAPYQHKGKKGRKGHDQGS